MIVLGVVIFGLPAIGLCIETYFASELEWHE